MEKSLPFQVVSVEDDAMLYQLIKLELRDLPIDLHHVWSGSEAILLLSRFRPDLIILDITLPDMRGWDVLDRLAKGNNLAGIPIIVLTAHKEAPHKLIAAIQGVTVFMNKPFRAAELKNTILEMLGLL